MHIITKEAIENQMVEYGLDIPSPDELVEDVMWTLLNEIGRLRNELQAQRRRSGQEP